MSAFCDKFASFHVPVPSDDVACAAAMWVSPLLCPCVAVDLEGMPLRSTTALRKAVAAAYRARERTQRWTTRRRRGDPARHGFDAAHRRVGFAGRPLRFDDARRAAPPDAWRHPALSAGAWLSRARSRSISRRARFWAACKRSSERCAASRSFSSPSVKSAWACASAASRSRFSRCRRATSASSVRQAASLSLPQLAAVQPVEALALPERLDGRDGTNRGSIEHSQLSARNDLDAVRAWLSNYADTKTTFEAYRKEAERLLLWAVVELHKPLSSLTHEDLRLFKAFLAAPQPASRWVSLKDDGTQSGKYARGDARWRPFNGPLSPGAGDPERPVHVAGRRRLPARQPDGAATATRQALHAAHHALPVARAVGRGQRLRRATAAGHAGAARVRRTLPVAHDALLPAGHAHFRGRRRDHGGFLPTPGRRWTEPVVARDRWQGRAGADRARVARTDRRAGPIPPGVRSSLPSRAEATPLVVPFRGQARCLSRSAVHDAIKVSSTTPRRGCAHAGPSSPIAPTSSSARQRTGSGIRPARIRPTAASICARCATTWDTFR